MKILNLEPENFSKPAIELLSKKCNLIDFDTETEYLNNDYEGILTKLEYYIDAYWINYFPYIKFIATPTTGLTHIDLDYCKHKSIRVLSLKGDTTFLKDIWATAEHTMGLIFAITRKLLISSDMGLNRYQLVGMQLRNKTLGIVGYGRVGKQVEELARGIGLNVLHCDISDNNYNNSLDFVLYNSDIVTLHADYRQENKRMVNKNWFRKMKNGAYFINTSRGEMVNEEHLMEYLKNDKLSGAAIDVVSEEYNTMKNNTLKLFAATYPEKLIITPHIAGCTKESMEATDMFIVKKIIKEILT